MLISGRRPNPCWKSFYTRWKSFQLSLPCHFARHWSQTQLAAALVTLIILFLSLVLFLFSIAFPSEPYYIDTHRPPPPQRYKISPIQERDEILRGRCETLETAEYESRRVGTHSVLDIGHMDYTNHPLSPHRPSMRGIYRPHSSIISPLVSIITTAGDIKAVNKGSTGFGVFEDTVRSVLQQSFTEWEWILVMKGNEPSGFAGGVFNRTATRDARIRTHIMNSDGTMAEARNAGVLESRARYISFVDADDLLEPTFLEKLLWYAECHPSVGIINSYSVQFGAIHALRTSGYHDPNSVLMQNSLLLTSLIRRDILFQVNLFSTAIPKAEHWDLYLHLASFGHVGVTIPEFLFWYRTWPTTRSAEEIEIEQGSIQRLLQTKYWDLYETKILPTLNIGSTPPPSSPDELPFINRLLKSRPRLILVVPCLTCATLGFADEFARNLLVGLVGRDWDVTVVSISEHTDTTSASPATSTSTYHMDPGFPEYSQITPDVFTLAHIVEPVDYLKFIHYLIVSRHPDVIMMIRTPQLYFYLSSLRHLAPHTLFIQYAQDLSDVTVFESQFHHIITPNTTMRDWLVGPKRRSDTVTLLQGGIDQMTDNDVRSPLPATVDEYITSVLSSPLDIEGFAHNDYSPPVLEAICSALNREMPLPAFAPMPIARDTPAPQLPRPDEESHQHQDTHDKQPQSSNQHDTHQHSDDDGHNHVHAEKKKGPTTDPALEREMNDIMSSFKKKRRPVAAAPASASASVSASASASSSRSRLRGDSQS